MTPSEITTFIIGTAVFIIGYFLKIVHNDVRKNIEDMGKLKGKLELVEQENRLKYQAIQEQTQLELKMLSRNVSDLSKAVKELMIKIH